MTTVQPPRVSADEEADVGGGRGGAPGGRRLVRQLWRRIRGYRTRWWAPVVAAMLLGSVLHLLWLWLIASGGGDLAAQDAWAEFVGQNPGSAYNLAWYGGMHPVSYSVISPYVMAVVGVRPTLILSGVLSAGLLALLLVRSRGVPRPMTPALWGAFAFACNAASGRVTFGLGMLFAMGAVAVVWCWPARWRHRKYLRGSAAVLLTILATAGSPLAGLFLEVVAGALLLCRRRHAALALGAAPPVVVACSALLFPFQGVQPMPLVSVIFPLVSSVAVRLLAPPEWRALRRGAEIYTLGVVLTWAIPSQVGSNVERLGLLFGGVALLALVPLVRRGTRRARALVLAMIVVAGWQITKPTWDVIMTTPDAAWAHELAPLVHQLKKVDADQGRVEVVPARSHREASALTPYVNLARGWNRQADTDRNPLFYEEGGLTAKSYHDWLQRWAVRYVVLPSDDPDNAAKDEARIVRAGQPYLDEIWSDANWKLYRVADPQPIAAPPAQVAHAEAGELTVKVRKKGAVLVRVPWSPWLGLVNKNGKRIEPPETFGGNQNGCLRPAEPVVVPDTTPKDGESAPEDEQQEDPLTDEWTLLEAPRPGTYRIAAPYRLPRGTACPDGPEFRHAPDAMRTDG